MYGPTGCITSWQSFSGFMAQSNFIFVNLFVVIANGVLASVALNCKQCPNSTRGGAINWVMGLGADHPVRGDKGLS